MPFKQRPPFFLVWNPSQRDRSPRKRHKTVEDAEAEAQRLADLNPGKKFHVLLSLGRCTHTKVAKDE